jgi:hypothetical protein
MRQVNDGRKTRLTGGVKPGRGGNDLIEAAPASKPLRCVIGLPSR